MKAHVYLLLFAIFTCACAHRIEPGFHQGKGDVREFILSKVIERGGTPVNTNNLPPIPGKWRYMEDEFGVVVRLPRSSYGHVEDFMLKAFGQPKIGPEETRDGGRYGSYRLTSKGGGLSFDHDATQTQVIVLRPVTPEQALQRVPEVVKELQKQPPR